MPDSGDTSGYDAYEDPYCYRGSAVLKNRLGLRDQTALGHFEAEATAQRFSEPLPRGRFTPHHYRAIHRHIFGDIYPWAGRYRRVRIARGNSMFCFPEHIHWEMRRVFAALPDGRILASFTKQKFAKVSAHFLAELNAIHPFRDGNGRTQLAFVAALAHAVGHPLKIDRLEPTEFLQVMIKSFHGIEAPLADHMLVLVS
jgi:cell filamentation protein